ncbi:MAG: chromosome segregation protein SMC [Firmicutes bacterium]|nr:chromosome segregation protein SMC [Bacillota bacterium]
MRLKALELQGFKSFPDKTVLNFKNGVTVVVGPNGSGKSNISDAVRWVLGELSAKNMRGSKMEDVIFGGSSNRRPMGYAEVSLVIDNTSGAGKLDTEYDEVTVTRRYYRSGESEYMINRRPVRLKDISELFMNTGVGKTGYSIIGQGRVAEIISQKSDERRSVFEEAAGISKYRYKKNEAERKLADADANMLRLSDIINELGSRIAPLEKEAAAAKEYVELYEKKKEADIQLWMLDAKSQKERCASAEKAYSDSKFALDMIDSQIAGLETGSEKLYEESLKGRAASERTDSELNNMREQLHSADSRLKVLKNDVSHINEQITAGNAQIRLRASETDEAKKRAEELRKAAEAAKERLSEICSRIEAVKEEEAKKTELDQKLEDEIMAKEAEVNRKNKEIAEIRLSLSALEGSHEAESGRSGSLEAGIAENEKTLEELQKKLDKSKKAEALFRDAIKADEKEADEKETAAASLKKEADEKRREFGKLSADADALRQRADSLKRMDELLEGYNISVRNVMGAAAKGQLSGICGTVSQLIRVKQEHSVAIETALGASIQNIITDDENAAKAAIAFLKRTNGGRATFCPVTSVKAQQPSVNVRELSSKRGYVGMADTLASCEEKYSGVIGYMLGRTSVFTDIDSASDAAKALGYRIRIVTLDGQLINTGGSFTGGSVKHDSGMLTRASEIEQLREKERTLRTDAKSAEASAAEIEKKAAKILNEAAEASERARLKGAMLQAESTCCEVTRSKIESITKQTELLRSDIDSLSARSERYDIERSRLNEELENSEKLLEKAAEALNKTKSDRGLAADALADTRTLYNSLLVERAAAEKEAEAGEANEEFAKSTLEALILQSERSEKQVFELNEKLIAANNGIKSAEDDAKEAEEAISRLEAERVELIEKNLEREKKQNDLRTEIKEKTHVRENIFRDYTKNEAALNAVNEERDRMAAAMWDEYELTYSAAAALGYPALTEENRPETVRLQTELKRRIKSLGHVNVGAIEEYAEVRERFEFTNGQYKDICIARENLNGIIIRLEEEMRTRFSSAIDEINRNFRKVFSELFGGGSAEISLSDPEDVLNCGIEINVAPPGKIIKSLSLLSGGEQAFVAIALIFAILNVNPTPFCIFDEIEAALDEVNVNRFADYMKKYSQTTQFIVITHRRGTMEAGEMLYGITMPDRGVSKVLAMDVEEIEKRTGVKLN